jgi:chromosome segregation ATPase
MTDSPLTLAVLREIRDEARSTNERLDTTNERLDTTNERLDTTNERLESVRDELGRHIVESEMRTATAISELAGTVHELADVLRAQHDLRPRVDQNERAIRELERRLPPSA